MGPRQEFHSPESQVACRNIWHSAGTAIVGANLVGEWNFGNLRRIFRATAACFPRLVRITLFTLFRNLARGVSSSSSPRRAAFRQGILGIPWWTQISHQLMPRSRSSAASLIHLRESAVESTHSTWRSPGRPRESEKPSRDTMSRSTARP